MESQPQNPEFRSTLENFHPCETSVESGPSLDTFKMAVQSLPACQTLRVGYELYSVQTCLVLYHYIIGALSTTHSTMIAQL